MPGELAHNATYTDTSDQPHDSVVRVDACTCLCRPFDWRFAHDEAAAIDSNWARATRDNSAYFDGIVLLTSAYTLEQVTPGPDGASAVHAASLSVCLFETRFRNYLAWRHAGFRATGAIDGFGSAILRTADDAILLVSQSPGNVNEGLHYFPSGFIDRNDVDAAGHVDITASIVREMAEEIGLVQDDVVRQPGFTITRAGPHMSIGIHFQSALTADALALRISRYLATGRDPEIAGFTFVRDKRDLVGLKLAPHCAVLLDRLL